MVREFHTVIGRECREQCRSLWGRLPDAGLACVGGGSNAIGFFHGFLDDDVKLFGVEAGGKGLETREHAAPLNAGSPGILHGAFSYLMQDEHGQVLPTHSVSAGLDYPGVGPEHSYLRDTGRVTYLAATDEETLQAFRTLAETEGLIPAFESAHAFAPLLVPGLLPEGSQVVVNLSGRGDKDMEMAVRHLSL
jgi:tryptophan synthase beta chain